MAVGDDSGVNKEEEGVRWLLHRLSDSLSLANSRSRVRPPCPLKRATRGGV